MHERDVVAALRGHEARLQAIEKAAQLPVGSTVELPVVRPKVVPGSGALTLEDVKQLLQKSIADGALFTKDQVAQLLKEAAAKK